jgi:5S rRNA maturation endonuclease (ribonuclease M5)
LEAQEGAIVVVEGKKDMQALKALGLTGRCFGLSQAGFAEFLKVAEKHKKVILLLDYDAKGRRMFARALKMLQVKGITADSHFRNEVRRVTKGEVRHIEEVDAFAEQG